MLQWIVWPGRQPMGRVSLQGSLEQSLGDLICLDFSPGLLTNAVWKYHCTKGVSKMTKHASQIQQKEKGKDKEKLHQYRLEIS